MPDMVSLFVLNTCGIEVKNLHISLAKPVLTIWKQELDG